RKQTLKNQERFITPELKEYEDKVLRAEERAVALESELFQQLRERASQDCRRLQQTAEVLAQIDVLAALAALATAQRYCRPEITTDPVLVIVDGRHPVLDKLKPSGEFVPNDVFLGEETPAAEAATDDPVDRALSATVALITGPNMAGKSTYIRQAALLTILAQMGSFVPASKARIGIADRVFARVGASDELGKGQSTFMVEMTETARILNTATAHSLVILDEIGRGTSTYDGISLAWAITEFLHDEVRCRTLFATHYHELTELPRTLPRVANWNVAVHEQEGDVIFLHKIVPGSANRSYGIHVARLAGVPRDVIGRADVILTQLENDHRAADGKPTIPARPKSSGRRQLTLFAPEPHPVIDELKSLNIDEMTPLHALQELARIKERLK
ncbi:MAG: DNA mismatch repair protein MutS, partial [Planctomycetaceae bacterium]|nr:DNA mismatch repair protein MutS [Planctomycetaceae bacterium]